MTEPLPDTPPEAASAAGNRETVSKVVRALAIVLAAQALLALCLISAQQLLVPRNTPFGMAGPPSPVVAAVSSKVGLALSAYPSRSAAMTAINQGRLYRAYVTGSAGDTLIVVPAQGFFPQTQGSRRSWWRRTDGVARSPSRPLPPDDPLGAVPGLLLLPLLIGGYLAAVLVFKAAHATAAAPCARPFSSATPWWRHC